MITILGNVGNQGFALPMVQAYPIDVNVQQLLAWNPVEQALDYVPFVGNALGDFGVTRDLSIGRDLAVTRNATIGGTLTTTGNVINAGSLTVTGALIPNAGIAPTGGALAVTGNVTISGTTASAGALQVGVAGTGPLLGAAGTLSIAGLQVVATRKTGWVAATGTATRTTFDTATITLPQLAERVKALLDDATSHGLIGI